MKSRVAVSSVVQYVEFQRISKYFKILEYFSCQFGFVYLPLLAKILSVKQWNN
jgi:hypothetical protein